jgi:hypothetical protein
VHQEHLRALAHDVAEALFGDLEAGVVGVAERIVGRAEERVAAAPEIVDERLALRVGLQDQERIDLAAERDRLYVG